MEDVAPFPEPGIEHFDLLARQVPAGEAIEHQRAEIERFDGGGAIAPIQAHLELRDVAVVGHRHAHQPVHPAVVVALAPADDPLGGLAPMRERERHQAHGADVVAAQAALEEIGATARELREFEVLVVDPRGQRLVVGLPAQHRAQQVGLDLEHALVELAVEPHDRLDRLVGRRLVQQRLGGIARAIEFGAPFGTLELRSALDRHVAPYARARCLRMRWKSEATTSAVRSQLAWIQLGRSGHGP